MIDGSEKRNRQLAFELQNSHVCEKRSNSSSWVFQNEFTGLISLSGFEITKNYVYRRQT